MNWVYHVRCSTNLHQPVIYERLQKRIKPYISQSTKMKKKISFSFLFDFVLSWYFGWLEKRSPLGVGYVVCKRKWWRAAFFSSNSLLFAFSMRLLFPLFNLKLTVMATALATADGVKLNDFYSQRCRQHTYRCRLIKRLSPRSDYVWRVVAEQNRPLLVATQMRTIFFWLCHCVRCAYDDKTN